MPFCFLRLEIKYFNNNSLYTLDKFIEVENEWPKLVKSRIALRQIYANGHADSINAYQ